MTSAQSHTPEFFDCEIEPQRDTMHARLSGSLDIATSPRLRAQLAELRGFKRLVVDLSRLDFMDSSGLRLLLELDAEARQDGFALQVVPGPPAIQRVFEITGTLQHLAFVERGSPD